MFAAFVERQHITGSITLLNSPATGLDCGYPRETFCEASVQWPQKRRDESKRTLAFICPEKGCILHGQAGLDSARRRISPTMRPNDLGSEPSMVE